MNHPFSFSSAGDVPAGGSIALTIKAAGDFTNGISQVAEGDQGTCQRSARSLLYRRATGPRLCLHRWRCGRHPALQHGRYHA
jgi:predicted ferric reductase